MVKRWEIPFAGGILEHFPQPELGCSQSGAGMQSALEEHPNFEALKERERDHFIPLDKQSNP